MRILVFLLFSSLFAQSSVLSFGGFGEPQNYQNPTNIAVGQSELFSTTVNSGSTIALATIWQNRFTNLSISNHFQNLTVGNDKSIFANGIDFLSVSFPISETKAFQISLNPQNWTQYSINELNNPHVVEYDEINLSYKSHYYGRGGFSNFGVTWSQKINDYLSGGIRLNNYFGNKFQSDSTFTYFISLNAEGEEVLTPNTLTVTNSTHHYQGYGLKTDFIINVKNLDIGISYEHIGPFTIDQKKYYSVGISQSQNIIQKISNLSNNVIFGMKYQYSDKLGILSELKLKKWNSLDENYLILKTQNYDEHRISLGAFYHFLNQGTGFFNSITFRSGFYYKQFKNLESDFIINDYGVTFGTGFKYNKNANNLNLSFVFGNRKLDIFGIQNEKYFDFVLGIEVGDKWFLRKNK